MAPHLGPGTGRAPDPRDDLFSQIFEAHLRPAGFSRRGRTARREAGNGLVQQVRLESSTWNAAGRTEFGIQLLASHPGFRRDPHADRPAPPGGEWLMAVDLRRQADPPHQRWTLGAVSSGNDGAAQASAAFASHGVALVQQMSDLDSLARLCAAFGPIRYFEARSWCLRRLQRFAEADAVIQAALAHAPHDALRGHAGRLLARYGSLSP